MASTWSTGAYAPRTSPSVFDLLPELTAEEKARFPPQGRMPELTAEEKARFPPQGRIPERRQEVTTHSLPTPIYTGGSLSSEASRMRTAREALSHYNAEHPGAEFDAVKPLMEDSVYFRGKSWFHINFLACSRSSKNIERFFAEVHYEPRTDGQSFPMIPVVEACTIIDEPFSQYMSSCAFCRSRLEILHPADDCDFVCGTGKDKDWMIEEWFGMRSIRRRDLPSPNNKEEGEMEAQQYKEEERWRPKPVGCG